MGLSLRKVGPTTVLSHKCDILSLLQDDQIVHDNRLPVRCRHFASRHHHTVILVATQMSLPLVCSPPVQTCPKPSLGSPLVLVTTWRIEISELTCRIWHQSGSTFACIWLNLVEDWLMLVSRSRGASGGVKRGSICHFAFFLVLQCLGVSKYPDAGKTVRKCHCHTPFCVPQKLVKTRTREHCPQMLAGKAREK